MQSDIKTVIWFETLSRGDVALVGGKNSSLGEMVQQLGAKGIQVPPGFATTSDAFRGFIEANGLNGFIAETMEDLAAHKITLQDAGSSIRAAIVKGDWPEASRKAILDAYAELSARAGVTDMPVAVRSSATAEDLPDASFAGQQETFLNVRGETALLAACSRCYASLFTDRAITYRTLKGFDHNQVALSIGVQRMVRSDIGGSGVMFSIDTETGFDKVVLINAAWGLGENVVQGAVNPDEYMVYKPLLDQPDLVPIVEKALGAKEKKMIYAGRAGGDIKNVPTSKVERASFVLSDAEILELGRQAATIEEHYGQPMDMEWAKDGETGELFIVQARPETVQSRADTGAVKSYTVKEAGEVILTGLSVGAAVATGRICLIEHAADIDRFVDGAILVTSTTDPDWVPIMKRAAAIITDHGGRTSHAAIVSRELGLPAIVGTGNATQVLHDEQEVTVDCASGDTGMIHAGIAEYEVEELRLDHVPETKTRIMLNLANPSAAFRWWRLPAEGVGLARMEFVVNNAVQVHPMALVNYDSLPENEVKEQIADLTLGYDHKPDFFVETLARGLSRICSVVYPKPVIIRMSDFKTNEYAELLGGHDFEPSEENPMIGFRGASRYYSPRYRDGFALECKAIKMLRETMGFDNAIVMIPFCRTPGEADKVLEVMAENGLARGENGLQVYVMGEIPSNVIRAEEFAERFVGFSIGSNDLTQLTLGIDRDGEELADLFREDDPAVLWMIETLITRAHAVGAKVGLCGQAPSNDPAFARRLVEAGIDTISVTPDSFLAVKTHVAAAEG
ncbi:phosphoenolpyruvate synthase [Roseobacter sp. HKCCD9010]|uniref:phosphoenolpyruvate synthase n=1 Tax=unclassified Roseobacter TaxID=196798 RepID=UPI001492BBEC|nr:MULTISPECIES: phosphoenolpyruvate synthase [unclassified Roseobacter]MBF9049445.1 phosphoenolpyruvate synthase [Rhodobacterales bacterium HKCCD4356]NNV11445.1 phosphoenolpyruvate synthase [Roseobacter sp. HKCCD7357]NNV15629.1 phosphoenolpyruvate synthase [Roseobacter sp. HKCCD8768]NNV25089.1 phosphoenolpyruvate synthase [Roseobacter sp. HKCCD8192]NNV29346.1 phosphoenolpyruvate synthase [Roseobacter sp. HKCCD9061]